MSENANVGFLLGYGGWGKMTLRSGDNIGALSGGTTDGNAMIPLSSASYNRSMQIPMQSPFTTPFSDKKRTKFRTGIGTFSYSGSFAFEMTSEIRDLIFKNNLPFFLRNSFLDLNLCDGEGEIDILGAVWNSLTISAEAGGLIQGSIGFQSCNGFNHDINVVNPNSSTNPFSGESETDYDLEKYWQYGGDGIQSFDLNFTRDVQAVYLNEKEWIGPSYLKVGLTDASISVTCWEKWFSHSSIKLGNKTLKFSEEAFVAAKGYSFAGASGEGLKTYTNNAVGLNGGDDLFTVN